MLKACKVLGLCVVLLTPCVACHREIGEQDGTGDAGTSADSDSESSAESSGFEFDISRWVGNLHYEDPFHPFGESNTIMGSTTLANLSIRDDMRVVASVENCADDDPLEYEYQMDPISESRVRLTPSVAAEPLRYLRVEVDEVSLALDEDCGTISVEVKGGPFSDELTPVDSWKPGAACWVDKCTGVSPMGETTFQIDYCDGEEPESACQ